LKTSQQFVALFYLQEFFEKKATDLKRRPTDRKPNRWIGQDILNLACISGTVHGSFTLRKTSAFCSVNVHRYTRDCELTCLSKLAFHV